MEGSKFVEPSNGTIVRKPLHTRSIACTAFQREDGFLDVEGILVDVKPFDFVLRERNVPAGEPIHEMSLWMTLDWQLVIRDVTTRFEHSPYRICSDIEDRYKKLIGVQIKPGFRSQLKNLFRGANGCTHLTELVGLIATTAVQAQVSVITQSGDATSYPVGGCHTFRRGGEVVKNFFPEFYQPEN